MAAPPDIKWLVAWIPQEDEVTVVRSPYEGFRDHPTGGGKVDGCAEGDVPCYVLPPEVEASMGCSCVEEITFQHAYTAQRS